MLRPTALRAVAAPTRALAVRRTAPRAVRPIQTQAQAQLKFARTYATASTTTAGGAPPPPPPPPPPSGGGGNQMYIVLAAILGLAGVGYWYLKPVRDVAAHANQAITVAKDKAGDLGSMSEQLAKSMLPPTAFALYSKIASDGGLNGFLSNLKDKDLQGVIDEVKKVGGDDVKRIMEKVEKRVKEAKGKASDVDWKALAEDLKKELPESSQRTVEMLIGKIPGKEDFDDMIKKLKNSTEDKKKDIEAAAAKVLDKVKKAQKEGKGQADAFLKGLKEAAPGDVDALVKQLKDAAKSAGLPADTIESYLKSKAEDGKVNVEEAAAQLKDKLRTGAKWIPGEPKELVAHVKEFSPSIAELLAQALKEAGVVDDKLNRKV